MDLNYKNVLETLNTAAGPDRGAEQISAEQQLKTWEICKGYHYFLQQAYNDISQPLPLRWLAVICLKNGVDRYWRPTRMHAISPEEKVEIRNGIFNQLDESNKQLTIQNAHTVARICRHDFPMEWPNVFDQLAEIIQASTGKYDAISMTRTNNALIILNEVLKTLSAVRIGRARLAMQQKMPMLFPCLVTCYNDYFNRWIKEYDAGIVEVNYVCIKCLWKATVNGFKEPHRQKIVRDFMQTTLVHFQLLLQQHTVTRLELLERFLKCYVKMYLDLCESDVASFMLFPCSISILQTLESLIIKEADAVYQLEDADGSGFWEQMVVKSFLVLKKVAAFGHKGKSGSLLRKEDKGEIEKASKMVLDEIFTPKGLAELLQVMITHYLRLRPCDLEAWNLEPEQWTLDEMQTSWEYQARPCAERLFQDLASYYKPMMAGMILDAVGSILSDANSDTLTRDSAMCVFELSTVAVPDKCNFDEMFSNFFLPQAMNTSFSELQIIRRRVCLVIKEWTSVQCAKETRNSIYKFLDELLDFNQIANDKVVRLTACVVLKHMLSDWEFRKKDFQPYLESVIIRSLTLLKQLELTESKKVVLEVISLLVERNGSLINDSINSELLEMVTQLWQESEKAGQPILQNSLLRLLKELTRSLGPKCGRALPLILPLIPVCCSENAQYYTLLSEDGYELWSCLLKQLPSDNSVLIPDEIFQSWFPLVVGGLKNATEILPLILNITRSYMLLNPSLFSSQTGFEILKVLGEYLPTMRDDSLYITSQFVEIMVLFLAKYQQGQHQLEPNSLLSEFVQSGLFDSMMKFALRETKTPNCEIKLSFPLLRLAIMDPKFFIFQLLPTVIDGNGSSLKDGYPAEIKLAILFGHLMTNFVSNLKLTYDAKARKLFLLALLSFYDTSFFTHAVVPDPQFEGDTEYQIQHSDGMSGIFLTLTSQFGLIMSLASRFLEEIHETPSGDCKTYHSQGTYDDEELVLIKAEEEEEELDGDPDNEYIKEFRVPDSSEKHRFTELVLKEDPIFNVNLKSFVQSKMSQMAGNVDNYNVLLSSVSKETLDDLQLQYDRTGSS